MATKSNKRELSSLAKELNENFDLEEDIDLKSDDLTEDVENVLELLGKDDIEELSEKGKKVLEKHFSHIVFESDSEEDENDDEEESEEGASEEETEDDEESDSEEEENNDDEESEEDDGDDEVEEDNGDDEDEEVAEKVTLEEVVLEFIEKVERLLPRKNTKKKEKKEKIKYPKVGDSIEKIMREFAVGEENSLVVDEILDRLTKIRPDKKRKSMKGTIRVHLQGKLEKERNIPIRKGENGFYIEVEEVKKKGKNTKKKKKK